MQQRRRKAHGQRVGHPDVHVHLRARHARGIVAREHRNLVLLLGDAQFEVGNQRRGARQLDLRLLVGRFGGQSSFETQFRLTHALLAGLHRAAYDAQFVVQSHQLEVGRGDLRHECHLHGARRLDRGEVFGRALALGPAQVAPQVGLPTQGGFHVELGVALVRFAVVVVGLVVGSGQPAQRRQPGRLAYAVKLLQLADARLGREHVAVAVERAADQPAECRVGVDLPPLPVAQRQRVALPGDDLRGHVELRSLALLLHGAASRREQQKHSEEICCASFHRVVHFSFSL